MGDNNTLYLPGYMGYGISGDKGDSGMSGYSFYYTPYIVKIPNKGNIGILNPELMDKIYNNLSISTLNSFEKLEDRVYIDGDIICDNEGKIFKIDTKNGDIKNFNSDSVTKLNIQSLFSYTDFYNKNGYNRITNNSNTNISTLQSNEHIYKYDMKNYGNHIMDFTNTLINLGGEKRLNKVYNNGNNSLYISFDNISNTQYISTDDASNLSIDTNKLLFNNKVFINEHEVKSGEIFTSSLASFLPYSILQNDFFTIVEKDGYLSFRISQKSFFNDASYPNNLLLSIHLYYKNDLNKYINKGDDNLSLNNINFFDNGIINDIKVNMPHKNGYKRYVYISITDINNNTKVLSKIRKI